MFHSLRKYLAGDKRGESCLEVPVLGFTLPVFDPKASCSICGLRYYEDIGNGEFQQKADPHKHLEGHVAELTRSV